MRSPDNENEKLKKGDDEIKGCTEERRSFAKGEKQKLKELSKRIKKCIRDKKTQKYKKHIQRIFEEFRSIKNISNKKSQGKIAHSKFEK